MVNEDWSGYTNKVSMEIVEATYKLWIDNLRVRHGRKFKNTYSRVVPILDRFTFIGKAARTDIASPETAQRCRLVKSSSLMPDGAPPASPEDIPAGEQFEGARPSTD